VQVHAGIEQAFEGWGRFVVRHRWATALAVLLLTGLCASWAPQLRSDNSIESFLRPSDPARANYDAFREQFGQDEMMVVAIRPPEVFDLSFLDRLRAFHEAIEDEVPYLDEVTSLWNARNTRGEGDQLIVEDLLEEWPEDPPALERLKRRVLENPFYLNTLINRDATFTAILIKPLIYSTLGPQTGELKGFDDGGSGGAEADPSAEPELLTEEESAAQVEALLALCHRTDAPDFEIHVAGGPVVNRHATQALMRDTTVFMVVGIAVIAGLLYLLFRRLSGVVSPLLVVLLSLLATYGLMAKLGIPTSVSGQVLPMLLLAVGICSAVHIVTLVYQRLAAGESKPTAIAFALGHSGLAVAMATLTTAGGLLSFVTADLAQVANIGLMAPIGIVLTFVYCVTLLPALLALAPLRAQPSASALALQQRLSRWLAQLGSFATRRPRAVVAGACLLVLIGGLGVRQLRFSQDGIRWFPEDDPVRQASEFIDREFGGAATLEVVVDTGRENGLHDPELLRRVDRAMRFAEALDGGELFVGNSFSIVDIVKETHKALHENQHEYYRIPDDRPLLAQELLLFENSGSDDLEQLTDSQFRVARVNLRIPFGDGMRYPAFIARIEQGFREILGPGVGVQMTGVGLLFARTFSVVNPTMARSYVIALLIITPLMILLIGNLRRGVLSMLPNLIPIWLTLALMGWLEIPLDTSSLLVGCIIIGVAVDDTIHFMHKFQRYFAGTGDAHAAVMRTLETTGAALLFTSLVLASAFAVTMLAYMRNAAQFGLLATFATVVAFLADVVLSPALMVLATGRTRGASMERAEPVRA
jgi:predicted RND superfamily exporter protein